MRIAAFVGIGGGILLVITFLVAAVVLLVRGRRARLAGVGFLLGCVGTAATRGLTFAVPNIEHEFQLSSAQVQLVLTAPQLITLVGWVLVIVALFRFLRSAPAPFGTVPSPGRPSPGPGPGGPQPGYGVPPAGPPPGPPPPRQF